MGPLFVRAHEIPDSEFRRKLKAGQLVDVTLGSPRIVVQMKNASATAATSDRDKTIAFDTVAPPTGDPKLLDELDAAGVKYRVKPPPSPLGELLLSWLFPLGLLGVFWYSAYPPRGRRGRRHLRRGQEQGDRGHGGTGRRHVQRRRRRR